MKILRIIKTKIRNKLLFGFVIVSLFVGFVSYIGVRTIHDVGYSYDNISTKTLPLIQNLEDMKFACLRLVSSASEYAYIQTERKNVSKDAPLNQENELIKQSCNSCHTAFSKYERIVKESFPNADEQIKEIRKGGNLLHTAANEFVEMKKQGISGTEALEKKEEMEVGEKEFLYVVNQAIGNTNDRLEEENSRLVSTISSSLRNILVFSGLTFIISILLGLIMSRLISSPILRLTQMTNEFREGNLNATIETKSTDEIGVLGRSFQYMAEQIKLLVSRLENEIKESKSAADKLRFQNEIMTNMTEAVYLFRLEDNVIVYTNSNFEHMFGYGQNELLGKHVSIINAPTKKSPEEVAKEIGDSIRENNFWRGEVNNIKKDGTSFWCHANVSVFEHSIFGKVFVSFHTDITERKQAEKLQDAVYRITKVADVSPTIDDLFKNVHNIIKEVMPADNFYIALYDEKENLISTPYFVDEFDPLEPPRKPGKGLTEYVIFNSKSILCEEKLFQEMLARGEVESIGSPSPIWLGVPLIVNNKTIGMMAAQHYSDAKVYARREQQIFEFVSSEIARVIEKRIADEEEVRLINELKEALANVKTLNGLLPICASCKNIRDDKGYWQQVEGYIMKHTEASFTHGICPDCAKKLYPDLYKKK